MSQPIDTKPLKLSHYSMTGGEISMERLFDVATQRTHDAVKPEGLWLSVDGDHDWENWCKDNSFRLDKTRQRQSVTLRPDVLVSAYAAARLTPTDVRVCYIKNAYGIDEFHKKYRTNMYPGGSYEWIDWPRVAVDYDGLLIAPYVWERRMNPVWYYPWDCASAAIWRPTKVIATIGKPEPIDWTHPHMPIVTHGSK